MRGNSEDTKAAGTAPNSDASSRRGRPWAPWAAGAGGVVLVVVLVLGAARPDWAAKWWDGSGLDCGRGLSTADREDLASVWAAWGDGDHEPAEDHELEDHRTHIEELAAQLDAEPVGEIATQTTIAGPDGSQEVVRVYAEAQDELIRTELHGEDGLHRFAAIDPTSGAPAWHWDLDEGRDSWVEQHGEHLVMVNRIERRHDERPDAHWTDMLSLDPATGDRQGCHRVTGSPGYGSGSTDAGLVVDTESRDLMAAEEEQDVQEQDEWTRTIQQVALPTFTEGFERTLPPQEFESLSGFADRRPHALVTLPGGLFLTYSSLFAGNGTDALTSARHGLDFPTDTVPVEAFSMDTGESLWSHGEPGDRIAFVSGVQGIPGDASGVLLAELGEFEPSADDPELGTSTVTLRMLDAEGEQLWDADGADVGADFAAGASGAHYLRALGDVILVHTAPHEVTALDAATGEELWSIGGTEDEPQALWLYEAISLDGNLFLPGHPNNYMVDARTGEADDDLATTMIDARIEDVSTLGEDMLLVTTLDYGHVILQKR
ncbi:outer membrane protein assembly factor BamB family protein [Brachybacterium sp. AOP43-C2-M15]|uniref:outer membrane protein assembly factor BamB family protein n=1 Tax=Brachybacterium sp. AOP43-C2-M15 TaxID=3457661 RepID=UPI004034BCE8